MAKHKIDGKGKVSKGTRVSCYGTKRQHPKMPTDGPIITRMREAFGESLHLEGVNRNLGRIVVHTMAKHQRSGVMSDRSTWNASLSHRTYLALRVVCGL